ncbi:hypothetical protein [Bacillus phage YungSlug]|nr:hypothetical protein [Bacillus phage YungSlug]
MTNVNETLINRIKKLFNMTVENGCSESEAQSAMLMAQKLMAKNGLEMSDVELKNTVDGTSKEVKEDGIFQENTVLDWWEKSLAVIIADNFKCYTYVQRGHKKSNIIFMGLKDDVEVAKLIYNFAHSQITHLAKQYRRKRRKELEEQAIPKEWKKWDWETAEKFALDKGFPGHEIAYLYTMYNEVPMRKKQLTSQLKKHLNVKLDGVAVRNDFIRGFLGGLKEMFAEQVKTNEAEWGLVLVKDDAVVTAYEAMNFKRAKASTVSTNHDTDALNAGFEQGKNFKAGSGFVN